MTLYKNLYRIESTRLPHWDYRRNAYYFVTICTQNRQPSFGEIEDGEMHLSATGRMASLFWTEIPVHSLGVTLDAYVIMPNHVHGILAIQRTGEEQEIVGITNTVETLQCNVSTSDRKRMSHISPKSGSLSAIVRSYKAAVTRWCQGQGVHDFAWQPRFYEHIVRDERSLQDIRRYVVENPQRWPLDRNNSASLWI